MMSRRSPSFWRTRRTAAASSRSSPRATTDFREPSSNNQPEMVALDLGMPGMDGVELLRFLADQDYRGPVLIVSGFDRRVLESAFRLGEALGLADGGPGGKAGSVRSSRGPAQQAQGGPGLVSPATRSCTMMRGLQRAIDNPTPAHGLPAQDLPARRKPDARSKRWCAGTIPSSAPVKPSRLRSAGRRARAHPRTDSMGPADDPAAVDRLARRGPRHLHRLQYLRAQPAASRLSRPRRAHVPRARCADATGSCSS